MSLHVDVHSRKNLEIDFKHNIDDLGDYYVINVSVDNHDSVTLFINEGVELDDNTKRLLALLQTQNEKTGTAVVGEDSRVCDAKMEKRSHCGHNCKQQQPETPCEVETQVGESRQSKKCNNCGIILDNGYYVAVGFGVYCKECWED